MDVDRDSARAADERQTHLDLVGFARRLHARRDVHGVSPDVVVRFTGTDHTGDHWTHVDSCGKVVLCAFKSVYSG